MRIKTLPVYSKLAETVPPEIAAKLPSGWQLSQHQLETYQALTGGQYDVIFNTAMTGDGKSLAGQLPTLLNPELNQLFAMYPTNELARDQEIQISNTKNIWRSFFDVGILNGNKLDELMAEDDFSQRGDAVLNQIRNYEILLTNPDIFHYIMTHFYRRLKDAPDTIIGTLVQKFHQFTFDEFHVFETPQVISVVNAMLFINQITGNLSPRFLFLSATPDEQMKEFLARSGLTYCIIDPAKNGGYLHTHTEPNPKEWRRILYESDIHFAKGQVEEWVNQHLDDILLPFFRENTPLAKGAIIVNSIATAKRLTSLLEPIFKKYKLTVAENTGLTSQAGRIASYEADLLIGTSTIDVGVDFNINFLLFESRDAGTFLQRLGRLGRHSNYIAKDGQKYSFNQFVAYALTPPWIMENLFPTKPNQPDTLTDGVEITRQHLNNTIQSAYPQPTRFDNYIYDWGKFQSSKVITRLNDKTISTQYSLTRDLLAHRYQQTFNIKIRQAVTERKYLSDVLLDEAMSFRGGSYFQCAILDETETEAPGQPKLADLFMLVQNGHLEGLEELEFYAEVKRWGISKRPFENANGSQSSPLAYFRLLGWRNERNDYELRLQKDLTGEDSNKFGQAIAVNGFRLNAFIPNKTELNNRLQRRTLPALLCLAYTHPLELKRRLYLPMLFPIYPFISLDNRLGCVAFGREALLLHTKLKRRHDIDCGGGALIF